MRTIAGALVLLLGLLAAGCNGELVGGGQTPSKVLVVSGDMQTATVGQELAQPLVARVVDENNRPVANQLVNFVVTSGGGSVFAGAALTNEDGEARERWRLGTVAADSQRVEARAVDPATGAPLVFGVFRATAVADQPAALTREPATASGQAGTALADSLRARVLDRYGNPVAGVTVSWSAQNGGAVSPATSQTGADGRARTQWTLGPALGEQTAQASAAGLTSVTFSTTATVGPPLGIRIEPRVIRFDYLIQVVQIRVESFDALGHPLGTVPATVASLEGNIVSVDATTSPARAVSVMNGTARIVASYQGAVDTVYAVVAQEAAEVEVTPDSSFLMVGESVAHTAVVRDRGTSRIPGAPVAWTSSAPGIAPVDAGGRALAAAPGSAILTANAGGGVQAQAKVEVFLPYSAQTVDAGGGVTCAVEAGGTARCWGDNNYGQLGTGTSTGEFRTPMLVAGGHTWVDVQPSVFFGSVTCGLTTAGKAYCWGAGPALGNGTFSGSNVPSPVAGDLTFTKISVGSSTNCGLTADGSAYCWGSGRWGVLGNGDTIDSNVPVRVASAVAFTDLSVGWRHACALTAEGTAYCWGQAVPAPPGTCAPNLPGHRCSALPRQVGGGRTFVQVVTNSDDPCALGTDGVPWCGYNLDRRAWTAGPVLTSLAAGYYHTCGRTSGGEAWCWGRNSNGQTGGSEFLEYREPIRAAAGLTFTSLSAGLKHTCGVTADGAVYCWGGESDG
ncbi:MAG TPA: Ig-like domain-containing protein, partial [Longimicrobium sp.]|nr:Ig-like domain-containing protein [Longimicrobium sp.]